MKKMQIVLDEDKIRREGAFDPVALQAGVDDLLVGRYGLVKGEGGFYYENGQEDGFFGFMSSALILKDRDGFLDNVKTWLWYNSDDMPEPDMFSVEDAKEFFLSTRAEAV